MFNNSNIHLSQIYLDGLNHPKLRIIGQYKNKVNQLKLIVDGKNITLKPNIILNKKYVETRIKQNNPLAIDVYADLPSNSKTAQIYLQDRLLVTKNISYQKRLLNLLSLQITKIIKIILRFPKIFLKTIKLMWTRHHFLIPPRMFKQYLNSFRNNMNNKNIDELLYNPLIDKDYRNWLSENKDQVKIEKLDYNPLISLVIPTYNVNRKLLTECLDSILNQTYKNFEICIADDHSTNQETIDTLKEYERNPKIKIIYRETNGHISEATNTALKIAQGEFIGLIDNDDTLDKNALYYVAKSLNQNQHLDLIYSDEDKLDFNGQRCFPHFKSDFAIDTLLSSNYICHFTVIRKSLVDQIGGFRSEYNGAQDYDLFLRITELTANIHHIPKILYHWRMTEGSTSSTGDNKNYAYLAGQKALEDYFKRQNIPVKIHLLGTPQMYQVEYLYESEPKISIIIPTKDKSQVLDTCLKSIYEKTTYKNYEIIVIDNNSTEASTFNLLKKYQQEHANFSSYRYECEFNYSYLNNEAVQKSTGDYIVLLNNDTEVITPNWLNQMVGYAMQKHIGCVGAKLLYPNQTIQHCGVVIGVGGIAMHAFVTTGDTNYGYFGRLVAVHDWSCVTAACLMIKKSKYQEVAGLDEQLKVAYNDVDLNLKLLQKGYHNVVLPQVKLHHYESLSRGNDMSSTQITRFTNETNYMCDKWQQTLLQDKYYNNNLSYEYTFRLDRKNSDQKNEIQK